MGFCFTAYRDDRQRDCTARVHAHIYLRLANWFMFVFLRWTLCRVDVLYSFYYVIFRRWWYAFGARWVFVVRIAFHGVCSPRAGFVGDVCLLLVLLLRTKQLQLACSFTRDRYRYEMMGMVSHAFTHIYTYIFAVRMDIYMYLFIFVMDALSISTVERW